MSGRGGNGDFGIVYKTDVIVGGNAALAFGGNFEGTLAAEDELAFGKEGRFLVLFGRCGRIGRSIGKGIAAVHNYETAFFTLIVDGGAIGVGQVQPVQDNGLLVLGIDLEEAVRRAAGQLVHHLLLGGGVVGCNLVAIYGNDAFSVTGDGGP